MPYKAVIFDLDGTLINSLNDLADSGNELLRTYGYDPYPVERYRYFVGNGSRKLMERILPAGTASEEIDKALVVYKGIYAQRYLNKTRPYAGMPEVLAALRARGIKLGVCTNKHMEAAATIVDTLFKEGTFDELLGDKPGMKRKPDPSGVLAIAASLGVKPEEVAYLGDTQVDMLTAKNAGFYPVGVLWGFRDKQELLDNGAQVLLSRPEELLTKVEFAK